MDIAWIAAPRCKASLIAEAEVTARPDPTPPADDAARRQARSVLRLTHGALAYIAEDGAPGISRIALGLVEDQGLVTLISGLAPHSAALRATPDCAVMVGEPDAKGDPLTHPRLMIKARAGFVARDGDDHQTLRLAWLQDHPKAKLYVDFTDFTFVRLRIVSALLNGGFGKAFRLMPQDLIPPPNRQKPICRTPEPQGP